MAPSLEALSSDLVNAVAHAGRSVVRVDDGTRLTASGVAWSDTHVIATSHGVERDDDLAVETYDGTRLPATLLGRDHEADLALLKVEGGLEPLAPAAAQVGAFVLAVGRPGDAGMQATFGIVGSLRPVGEGHLIHTDARLYPGFSGGALVGADGGLLGVLNLGGRGRGFALGSDYVASAIQTLSEGGARRGYLGVRIQPVELGEPLRERLRTDAGLLVTGVEAGSPAEAGGVLLGDVLLRVEGQPLDDARTLRQFRAGQTVTMDLLRGGEARSLPVTLGAPA